MEPDHRVKQCLSKSENYYSLIKWRAFFSMELLASTAIPHPRRWQCAWWLCWSARTPGGKQQGKGWDICVLFARASPVICTLPRVWCQMSSSSCSFLTITGCSCWFFWTPSGGNDLREEVRALPDLLVSLQMDLLPILLLFSEQDVEEPSVVSF